MGSGKTPKTSKQNEPEAFKACEYAGLAFKTELIPRLEDRGVHMADPGVVSDKPADNPDLAAKVAEALRLSRARRGIRSGAHHRHGQDSGREEISR